MENIEQKIMEKTGSEKNHHMKGTVGEWRKLQDIKQVGL
jgi:hypothetical protein